MVTKSDRKVVAILLTVLMIFSLVILPAGEAAAYSRACDQFVSCHSPGDCAWWAVRCALYSPTEFMEISWDW